MSKGLIFFVISVQIDFQSIQTAFQSFAVIYNGRIL